MMSRPDTIFQYVFFAAGKILRSLSEVDYEKQDRKSIEIQSTRGGQVLIVVDI